MARKGVRTASQIAQSLLDFLSNPTSSKTNFDAYHGSPFDFDSFDLGFLGKGEGDQKYGRGSYLSEAEQIAERYKKKFPNDKSEGFMYEVNVDKPVDEFLDFQLPVSQQSEKVQDFWKDFYKGKNKKELDRMFEGLGSQNSDIAGTNILEDPTGADLMTFYGELFGDQTNPNDYQRMLNYRNIFSDDLIKADIPGTRYLDPSQRGMGYEINVESAPEPFKGYNYKEALEVVDQLKDEGINASRAQSGMRNVVVFNPELIKIVKKYGVVGAATYFGVSVADINAALADEKPPASVGMAQLLQKPDVTKEEIEEYLTSSGL